MTALDQGGGALSRSDAVPPRVIIGPMLAAVLCSFVIVKLIMVHY
jgi:hypothetical protein